MKTFLQLPSERRRLAFTQVIDSRGTGVHVVEIRTEVFHPGFREDHDVG